MGREKREAQYVVLFLTVLSYLWMKRALIYRKAKKRIKRRIVKTTPVRTFFVLGFGRKTERIGKSR